MINRNIFHEKKFDGNPDIILAAQSIDKKLSSNNTDIRKTWIRNIRVTLTSKFNKDTITFESADYSRKNYNEDKKELNIDIQGSKNLALNKDKGTVTITNLPYDLLVKIIAGKYYLIEIFVGYGKDVEPERYFKGEVSYISQKIHSRHDTDTYITYASTYVAKFSQQRINLSLNSGINLYTAIEYISNASGMHNVKISPSLKNYFTQATVNLNNQAGNLIEQLASQSNQDFYLSTDESDDEFYIDCTTIADKRRITINPNMVIIAKGNPTISSAGMQCSLLPMINLKPGDIIIFPNYLINASISNAEEITTSFPNNFFSPSGQYMIRQIQYHFQNRAGAFELNITAVALEVLQGVTGGTA